MFTKAGGQRGETVFPKETVAIRHDSRVEEDKMTGNVGVAKVPGILWKIVPRGFARHVVDVVMMRGNSHARIIND